jgi:hypothetical protein
MQMTQPGTKGGCHVAFVAYPSSPHELADDINAAIERARMIRPSLELRTWQANDVPGRCLVDPILQNIDQSSFVIADVTRLNFNVVYEIGYAIGREKRVFLVFHVAVISDDKLHREVGIFDTLGYQKYGPASALADYLVSVSDFTPLPVNQVPINTKAPVYIVAPREKTEAEIRIISRVKKARLFFRSFDPEEHGRMSARDAIDGVAASHGVILPLLSSNRVGAFAHNLRCAFVAGLSHALGRETLLLQAGDEPIPLDLRDVVRSYASLDSIDPHIASFAPQITERLQHGHQDQRPLSGDALSTLFLGASAAENEFNQLGEYYIQTDEYQRVLRGEVRIVAGRKGSGKSALFFQVRNRVRSDARNLVLDLNPEGFQLRKLKTVILRHLEEGTREHTITAFWEYLILVEVCNKWLEKVARRANFDPALRETHDRLIQLYHQSMAGQEGDFAERMLQLTEAIEARFENLRQRPSASGSTFLTRDQITEILYSTNLRQMRKDLVEAVAGVHQVWILFDNVDKGWRAQGIDTQDLMVVRCLIDALEKVQRHLRQPGTDCFAVVFLRNDVLAQMIEATPDRGKVSRVTLDWTDAEMFRELLRRRFLVNLPDKTASFDSIWHKVVISHLPDGSDSADHIISRSLMRPRGVLELAAHCKSHAVNLGHRQIDANDILQGEIAYSTDLINNIDLEIQDVFPGARDVLYGFIEAPEILDRDNVRSRLHQVQICASDSPKVIELLLWYGFLGVVRSTGERTFIYDVNYEMKKLEALAVTRAADMRYCVNPAFWKGLEISVR